jgi:hypothetical protein
MFAAKMPSAAYGFPEVRARQEFHKLALQTSIILLQNWPTLMAEGFVHGPRIPCQGPSMRRPVHVKSE